MSVSDPPPLITECPNCNTRFRVGESQLQMAHGRVRCGACLAVFAGVDHLLLDDSSAQPELPAESNALDSVLAELDIDSEAAESVQETGQAQQEKQENQESGLGRIAHEQSSGHDWTSVSVDTQEFGRELRLESGNAAVASTDDLLTGPRVSIEDALNDEEALRWWLEDELPGESGSADEPVGSDLDDGMVVQLSRLDTVQDEELDLQTLIANAEDDTSARVLQELFEEDALETQEAAPYASSVTNQALEGATPQDQPDVLGEVSANELQCAIDEAEPLVSRAMANGTIAAAAERMSAATARKSNIGVPEQESAGESVALITSPHQAARSAEVAAEISKELMPSIDAVKIEIETKVPLDSRVESEVEPPASVLQQQTAKPDKSASKPVSAPLTVAVNDGAVAASDPWDSANFPELSPASVVDITEEMAAAGRRVVEPEPTFFERVRNTVDGLLGHALALRVATLLAFVLLVGQVLYWQFADWSKTATMRPVYASLCSVLGCELPARRSVRDLQSRKLAVRSHPEKADALLVDVLIINEASFEQPFPVIVLQFMDMSQQPVGSYRLEPSVYLDGELAGSDTLMAVRTPVHIDIDIPDPGPKAVNYQLQFR